MGLLTFSINLTLDGCVDHQEGIADDETHAFFTSLMDQGGAMLWGRVTYEMIESCVRGTAAKHRLHQSARVTRSSRLSCPPDSSLTTSLISPACRGLKARAAPG